MMEYLYEFFFLVSVNVVSYLIYKWLDKKDSDN